MENIAINFGLVFVLSFSFASIVSRISHDLDLDNVPDTIELVLISINEDQVAELPIKITYSKSGEIFSSILRSDSGSLDVYPGLDSGELVVDYSTRASRDSPELNYEVYRWNEAYHSFCLHIAVSGTPGNQLRKELLPAISSINIYDGCSLINDVAPRLEISKAHIRLDQSPAWMSSFTEKKISEWAALEISARMKRNQIKAVEAIAAAQADLGNFEAAAILYQAIVKADPENHISAMALANLMLDYGDTNNACKVYKSAGNLEGQGSRSKLWAYCSKIAN